MNTNELSEMNEGSKNRSSSRLVTIPMYTLLVLAVVWLYVEVGRFRSPAELLNVSTIDTRVTQNELDVTHNASQIFSLASELSVVEALARNADMYAHSHYSDSRLKKDMNPITDSLDSILNVQGVQFTWRHDAGMDLPQGAQIGVIAQDLQAVFPELVTEDENGFLSVDYAKLTPILLEAIREQQAQITELKQDINVLGECINALEDSTK